MARVVGIEIDGAVVRAALLAVSGRRVTVEQMQEASVEAAGSLQLALKQVTVPMLHHGEAFAASLNGTQVLAHRLDLPKTALKQLADVLPYEIEAKVPIDMDELVYDYHVLKSGAASGVGVLAVCARTEHVRSFLEQLRSGLGREPERVGAGAACLANLQSISDALKQPGPYALVDLGPTQTDVVIVDQGEVVLLRTLSRGVNGLPETAPQLSAELRQTFLAWVGQGGGQVSQVYLAGSGAHTPLAAEYLAGTLGTPVSQLPPLTIENLTPEVSEALPRFAKAIGAALGLASRPRDFDLRRGPLAFQRGYGFLKEKVPLLAGFAIAIVISFLFSMGSNLYVLSREREKQMATLAQVSAEVLGREAEDAEDAMLLLAKAREQDEVDPMPLLDAYDVLIEFSSAVPTTITHDIEAFDMQRGHVRLNGVLGTADEAQRILSGLKEKRCIRDANVSKISQAVNSDRKKYVLEFDVKCPEEDGKKKPKKTSSTAEAGDTPAATEQVSP
ncbi:MAG: hypothetical protein SFV15_02610 [Polyangiaceae bacterium]|nr:hypothetical protein [Polyangiaceae bacterium]